MIKTGQLEQRFGKDGIKGSKGEKWFYKNLLQQYDEVYDYRNDSNWQMFGVDFAITRKNWSRFFLLDTKTNFRNDGTFFVELDAGRNYKKLGWLFKSKSDRIVHINLHKEEFMWYDLPEMREELLFGKENYLKYISADKRTLVLNIDMFSRNSKLIKTKYNV